MIYFMYALCSAFNFTQIFIILFLLIPDWDIKLIQCILNMISKFSTSIDVCIDIINTIHTCVQHQCNTLSVTCSTHFLFPFNDEWCSTLKPLWFLSVKSAPCAETSRSMISLLSLAMASWSAVSPYESCKHKLKVLYSVGGFSTKR